MRQSLPDRISLPPVWSSPPNQPVLDATDVHVWLVSLGQPAQIVEGLGRLLAADEQARANRFHFETDRRHFIVARGYLRTILGRYLQIAPAQVEFTYADHGKPQLASPLNELKFNLAHSGGLALYAFTRIGEVGVDIEHIRPEFTGGDIAERFFSVMEVDCLNRLPQVVRHQAFFNCWTRKEAFIKAKGMGLSLPLDQFDVTLAPDAPAALLRTGWDEDEAARWSLTAIDIEPGYAAAVAIESHGWQMTCFRHDHGP